MTAYGARALAGPSLRRKPAGAGGITPRRPAPLLLALLLALPAPAAAQEAQDICLPLEAHQAVLADLRELRGDGTEGSGLRARVRLLDAKLALQVDQLHDLALARDLAVRAKTAAQGSLEAAVRGKREAEESRDAWYRAPALWFGTGLVGALLLAITVDRIQK